MTFAEPLLFGLLLLLPALLFLKKRGYLGYSDHRLLKASFSPFLWLVGKLPIALATIGLVALVAALARPQIPGDPIHQRIPGRDIILAVDISYSMTFPWKGELAPSETPSDLAFKTDFNERRREHKGLKFVVPKEGLQRIHPTQVALLNFIENRWRNKTGDRIGLIYFDTHPRYGWPITDDLRMLYRKAQFIQNNIGTGTNFGRNPPGPFDLAAEHFKESGQAKSRVLILVTDGEDDIDPDTERRLIQILQDNKIRLYLVGIGETLAQKEVGIVKLANKFGGHIFRVEDTESLNRCFATIDQLEKSEVTISQQETRDDVFFYFAWAALAALGLFLVSEIFILTR